MAAKNQIFTYLQAVCTVLALVLNSFLIYVVKKHTKSGIGAYKYVLITFATFEMTYAIVVLIGMPVSLFWRSPHGDICILGLTVPYTVHLLYFLLRSTTLSKNPGLSSITTG